MIRFFDLVLSSFGLIISAPLMVIIILVSLFETGSPLFLQSRVGRDRKAFTLVKFRTMRIDTPSVPTHYADASAITHFGRFLRRTKLDELPQLWNVLIGDMSLVGPRPCLFSQRELIEERTALGVFDVRPGITGLAQLNNVDMSTPSLLAKIDRKMLDELSITRYFYYIILTILGRGSADRVRG